MYLGTPVLGEYIFRIISYSCCIDALTIMECPFLCLLIFVDLKYILSETRIATPTFFLLFICFLDLPQSFILSLYVFLHMRWVSCIQHTDGFQLFIQLARLCLLMGTFSPFTFMVNIVMCEFDSAIFMLAARFTC